MEAIFRFMHLNQAKTSSSFPRLLPYEKNVCWQHKYKYVRACVCVCVCRVFTQKAANTRGAAQSQLHFNYRIKNQASGNTYEFLMKETTTKKASQSLLQSTFASTSQPALISKRWPKRAARLLAGKAKEKGSSCSH